MIIDYYDGTTPMLSSIMHLSREVAFEQMSKIGNRVRENAGKRMRSKQHNWHQESVNGKLHPYYDKSFTKQLGKRTEKDGSVSKTSSMSSMISSFLMEKHGTLVVGGRSPGHHAIKRLNGKIIGTIYSPGVGKFTQSIIHKLDTGERNKHHGWGKAGSEKQNSFYKDKKFYAWGFMQEGFNDSQSYAKEQITTEYEKIVGRVINGEITEPIKTRKKA